MLLSHIHNRERGGTMHHRFGLPTLFSCGATLILCFLVSTTSPALQNQSGGQSSASKATGPRKTATQTAKPAPRKTTASDGNWMEEALHNPKLMAEVSQLAQKLRDGIQVPGGRKESRIMPRLDDSTVFYVALPNYGETVHQALQIFREQLKVSPELRVLLRKHQLEETEANFESGLQKFYEFSQFLADEVVIIGKLHGSEPTGALVAEIKKPGLREFLEKINTELITSKSDSIRILDPGQLAMAKEKDSAQAPVVLLQPDLLVVGFSVSGLREFESQIAPDLPGFTSTALGQRLELAYGQGTSVLVGADLHRLVRLIPLRNAQDRQFLEKSGIGDVNYLAMSSNSAGGRATNIGEVTFNSPRHGMVSWIAPPAPMGALDFIPENAGSAGDIVLKNPAQIYDELREMLGESAFQSVTQMETQMGVNLKADLLSKLTGEIAFETPKPAMPPTATGSSSNTWTAQKSGPFVFILGTSDPDGLQQTLTRLLAAAPYEAGIREEQGVTIHTLKSPGSDPAMEIDYFLQQGYLVVATDAETANSALSAHIHGRSLAKSSKLLDTLESTQTPSASIMLYQDASQMLPAIFSQLPAEIRNVLPKAEDINAKPNVVSVSADERAFRGATNSNVQAEVSVGLVVAAMVIPNLLRSRAAAQEAAAVSNLRTLNTAQLTYATSYPEQGYASSMAMLGPGSTHCTEDNSSTPQHACLIVGDPLGESACTSGKWCEKDGYKFSISATCVKRQCSGYVASATPSGSVKSGKSFCTATDAVIRSHDGAPLAAPVTVAECRTWRPIN